MYTGKKYDCMLLATIAARFQEGLCVRIVANHIEGADGVEMERSSGCVLQRKQKMSVPAQQRIYLKNPYLRHFEWPGMEW